MSEVTNQVSNKTGWTNRQRPTEAFGEKSREKRRLHPSSLFASLLGKSPRISPLLPPEGTSEPAPVISGDPNQGVRALPKSLADGSRGFKSNVSRTTTHLDLTVSPSSTFLPSVFN